jgi:hypothetical protein
MRYFPLLLSAGIAVFSIPAAAAVSGDAPRDAIVIAYNTCPVYEGYPDCHPDEDSSRATYSGYPRSASRARIRVQ